VDDEPEMLIALRHLLADMQDQWCMEFVSNGAQALQLLSATPFDVVVADLEMPGIDGEQLLLDVMHRAPQTARIILCWQADQSRLSRVYGLAHQFLFKPCDPKALKETLTSLFACREWLADEKLLHLVSQLKSVPSLPSLYAELLKEMRSEDASLERAGEIVAKDPGMSAKMLHLVNSAFFGLQRQIASPTEAVVYLGIETIKTLVLCLQVFSQFDPAKIRACNLGQVWQHSWQTGVMARRLCAAEARNAKLAEQAFTAGLLHDIGKLVLAANLPEIYQAACVLAQHKGITQTEMELETFGSSHAQVGGFLLGLWGLPDPIVEAVAFHHYPAWSLSRSFVPLTAVHVANGLDHELAGRRLTAQDSPIDLNYLTGLGLEGRLGDWQEFCRQALAA
jgi:HD-like signal output (HDOD) protein